MLDSIRIAFLSEHASPLSLLGGVDAGGQNVYVDEVSRNLGTLGHTVDVFTRRDNPDVPDIVQWSPGVRIVHIAAGPPEFIPKDDVWPLMPAFRDGIAAFMLRNARTYDVIHSNFWMSGWVAAQLKPLLRVPVIHIFHAMGLTKRRHQGSSDTSPGERMTVEREVIARVDALIAQCPAEEHELIDDYAAEAGKVALIPSAVNVDTYRPIQQAEARHALGINPDVPLVVYVGRMLPRKDVRNVIRAVALMVEREDVPVELLLVGGESAEPDPVLTPEIGVLRSLARDLGIPDRVRFTGKRQPDVLCYYYSAADVVVTTPWYEPFGLTPLEAMACGRPVVG
ncbi:MAG: glycosyltransferase family 1 protein, partial [Chloroflexi bacterium]